MNSSPFSLSGQDVWIVGGAGYLGQAVVHLLASLEARVLCVDQGTRAVEANLGPLVTPATLDVNRHVCGGSLCPTSTCRTRDT